MKIVYIDRDGVINEFPGPKLYVVSLEKFHMLPDAGKAIKKLNDAGYKVIVVSNQAGVGKGVYSQETLDEITASMIERVKKDGGFFDDIRYCTHRPDEGCDCRKPNTGNFREISGKNSGELEEVYFIGDAQSDIQTAHNAGIKSIFVRSGRTDGGPIEGWEYKPDFIAEDLLDAVENIILKNTGL